MIAVDTSALMAVVLGETQAQTCIEILDAEDDVLISAGTVAEALIVAGHRNVFAEMRRLIGEYGFRVVAITPAAAQRIVDTYRRWGQGAHSASLNFGDCMAYEVAEEHACPLLYVGDDFARTGLQSAIGVR
jgi:ribonuclease VapC